MKTFSLLSRVTQAMEMIAPLSLADTKWDNVGVLVETEEPKFDSNMDKKDIVVLTIDYTSDVFEECMELKKKFSRGVWEKISLTEIELKSVVAEDSMKNCKNDRIKDSQVNLVIVAYHPVIFAPLKSLIVRNPKTKLLIDAIQANFSIYCPHTSLDATVGGMNDWFVSIIDPNAVNVKPIVSLLEPSKSDMIEEKCHTEPLLCGSCKSECPGYGRTFELSQKFSLAELIAKVKEGLRISDVHVALPYSKNVNNFYIKKIAVCVGSGGGIFKALIANNNNKDNNNNDNDRFDCFVTGEMSHHEVLSAVASEAAVILTRHTNCERGFLADRLQPQLSNLLNTFEQEVTVVVSSCDKDPLTTY